jgi:ABC-2 type transport system ATP-binding protein
VADDKAQALRSTNSQREVLEVELDGPVQPSALERIPGVLKVEDLSANRWRLTTDAAQDARPAVFQFAVDAGRKVLTLQKAERGLEDVFKELTRN